MSAPKVRADYEALNRIAQQFSQQCDTTRKTFQQLKRDMDTLQRGDWVGEGANKFYAEMNGSVLPTMQRLITALDNGATTTRGISKLMKAAEDEAARILTVVGTPGTLGAGGAGSAFGPLGEALGGLAEAVDSALGGVPSAIGRAVVDAIQTDSVLTGKASVKTAPPSITLPTAVNEGMNTAWKESFPGGHEQEQGGLIVKNKDGGYEFVRGPGGTGGTWAPNYGDLGGRTYVGLGHTHPYDSGAVDVPYSDADISFLFTDHGSGHQSELMVVQSGDTQFVLSRTEEFNKSLEGKTTAEVNTMIAEMQKLYNDTVAAKEAEGLAFAERYDAAVKAVADKYNLLYYKGKDGSLTKS